MYWLYAPLAGPPPQLTTTEMNRNMNMTTKIFEARRPEYLLCVAECPENVDRDESRARSSRCSEMDGQEEDFKSKTTHVEDGDPGS
jgi:hypothetical protein